MPKKVAELSSRSSISTTFKNSFQKLRNQILFHFLDFQDKVVMFDKYPASNNILLSILLLSHLII